ncbi:hypothetical protein SDC9_159479 [bioreactor metagenome]|uniref:Uncharacterized protein n=1 Tax=bioreactor metagenome TaxID=1076179 RepID=A0A645FCZ5_9ZZZZ
MLRNLFRCRFELGIMHQAVFRCLHALPIFEIPDIGNRRACVLFDQTARVRSAFPEPTAKQRRKIRTDACDQAAGIGPEPDAAPGIDARAAQAEPYVLAGGKPDMIGDRR